MPRAPVPIPRHVHAACVIFAQTDMQITLALELIKWTMEERNPIADLEVRKEGRKVALGAAVLSLSLSQIDNAAVIWTF